MFLARAGKQENFQVFQIRLNVELPNSQKSKKKYWQKLELNFE